MQIDAVTGALPPSQREFSAKEQTAFSIAVTFVTVFFFSSVLSTLLYGLVLSSEPATCP